MTLPPTFPLSDLPDYIAIASALGTAATGLVDTTKLFAGGVSRAGYTVIEKHLLPFDTILSSIPQRSAWETIYASWINGVDTETQKGTVKSLIKTCFTQANAQAMSNATGMDVAELEALGASFDAGNALTAAQMNIYGRLDAILSSILDAAYEMADQRYRNAAKALAAVIAVGLSVLGSYTVYGGFKELGQAVLVGLVATPLAPVAKDLTTAINTAVQASGKLRALLK